MDGSYGGKPCPKCAHVRAIADSGPDWQCPKCGIAYAKFQRDGSASAAAPAVPPATLLRRNRATSDDEYFDFERPEPDQLLFPTPKKTAGWLCGILVLMAIVLLWLYGHPASPLHGIKDNTRLAFPFFSLLLLALAGWNLYLAIVGRSFLIDGTAKLVSKNGERVAGFGGIRLVEVKLGYHPAIFPAGRSYALCLRLKSGESLALAGLRWTGWMEVLAALIYPQNSRPDGHYNDQDAADSLEAIAQEVAELIGVQIAKSGR